MSRKNRVEGKWVLCALCGVAGDGITLVKPNKDVNRYECAHVLNCQARRILAAETPYKQICSHSFCTKAAVYKCSCGLFLCEQHARSYRYHPGHIATPLPEQKLSKKAQNNSHKHKDKVELEVLHS